MHQPPRSRLSASRLRAGLAAPWRHLEIVEETGSTNADLVARAAAGEDIDGVVLIAEHQSAGKGRMGRSWLASPCAQIAMSVGVSAAGVPTAAWGWLPLAAGVAVIDAVRAASGVEAALKWPNDVLAGDGKLAGILAEVAGQSIVLGIGLNVTLRGEEVGQPGTTSLLELGVPVPDRTQVASELLRALGERVAGWQAARGADEWLGAQYRRVCVTIGMPVRATLPGGGEVVGTATSVDEQGRLCIATGGDTIAVSAGDVVHLRPTV